MRRSLVFIAAVILALVFGVQSGAQSPAPGDNPQYRPGDPRFQRNEPMRGDRRSFLGPLSVDLVQQAEYLSQTSFDYFMGWNGVISNQEQAILFKSEEFAAACRLFSKLAQAQGNFFRAESGQNRVKLCLLFRRSCSSGSTRNGNRRHHRSCCGNTKFFF